MSPAQTVIGAMITPALFILASASLVASALARLGRVVDRSRVLIANLDAVSPADAALLRSSLDNHQRRAIYAERSVSLFFLAVLIFVFDCLAIGLDHFAADRLTWLPVSLTIVGLAVIIGGAAYMVAESGLGARQIVAEISRGLDRLNSRGLDRSN
jgi:hypothetical protein